GDATGRERQNHRNASIRIVGSPGASKRREPGDPDVKPKGLPNRAHDFALDFSSLCNNMNTMLESKRRTTMRTVGRRTGHQIFSAAHPGFCLVDGRKDENKTAMICCAQQDRLVLHSQLAVCSIV